MADSTRVGFVGLGDIGGPMARCLAARQGEAGLDLEVFDLAPDRVAEVVAAGAKPAGGLAELATADVLCVQVNTDAQVRSVLAEVLEVPRERPLTFVIHSTVAPGTPAELEALAAPYGVRVVDAPVSGGSMGAADGRLAIMVGGTDEAFASVRPVLDAMAGKVVHAGPIGAGTRFKLARNLMHYASFCAATEAQRLAEAAGLDLVALGEVVRHTDAITGGPGAIMYRDTTASLAPDDFWTGVFGHLRGLAEKDLGFAIEMADQLGVDVPLARLARERLGPGLGLPAEA
ncbi:NAD(P)-dependent oxidoreductase [Nocardioides sp. GY 10113]|uniref:NAD(P)-dependent oxidoreductase n=1 Tax=Nocardioides sp. GY 10113 TaxID=2569761 RepID=UPI0010A8C785|nr:NAD(P)-dependent oxidoreductase [Nocardioides sp. GY 10113]TIC84886.1 NAD(P)-dependent oxidoreductase [Nocardioides sp. GY 10113]